MVNAVAGTLNAALFIGDCIWHHEGVAILNAVAALFCLSTIGRAAAVQKEIRESLALLYDL